MELSPLFLTQCIISNPVSLSGSFIKIGHVFAFLKSNQYSENLIHSDLIALPLSMSPLNGAFPKSNFLASEKSI
jgi:hypothetical protein